MVEPSRPRLEHGIAVAAPNLLTLVRLLSIPLIVSELLGEDSVFTLYALACVSDLLDGPVARRLGGETRIGMAFDAGTDFILVFGVSASLYLRGLLSLWFLALILVAFAQFAILPRAVSDPLGRHIGTVLFIALGMIILTPSYWVAAWSSGVVSVYITASLAARWMPRRSSSSPSSSS